MANQASGKNGSYLYAIIANRGEPVSGERVYDFSGICEGKVYTIPEGVIAAVVSDIVAGRIRPERRHLAAHQGVLKRLMEESSILPMSFGIIADSPGAIRKILKLNQAALGKQLRYLEDKVEMGLRVTWDVPNIFEYFVQTHPELQEARDRLIVPCRLPSHEEKIEIGQMFDHILNQDRQAHSDKVEEILAPYCSKLKQNRPRHEREIMNLACLIDRKAQKEFEEGVFEAAQLFDNNFTFDYNGPWAPHNFVELELKL